MRFSRSNTATAEDAARLLDRIESECGPLGVQRRPDWQARFETMQADLLAAAVGTVCTMSRGGAPSWSTMYAAYQANLDRRSVGTFPQ